MKISKHYFFVSILKTCLLLFATLFLTDAMAQDPTDLLAKYWQYRDRFLGNDGNGGFISLGLDPGESIPVSGRNRDCDCATNWHLKEYDCNPGKGTGKVQWGDAIIYHGSYLAVLALEYHNLKQAGQLDQLPAIKEELYYAIKVMDRVDLAAEVELGLAPKLDGFFLRDDVPRDFFIDSTKANNIRFPYSDNGYSCVQSAVACGERNSDDGSFISQDQVIGLFFGFAFVKLLLEEERYGNSEETFGEMVTVVTHRITNYLMESKWRLRGPDGVKISPRWGGDLRGFNNLIAKMASKICGTQYRDSYQKGSSKSLGWAIRGTFDWGFGIQAERNHWMIFCLATVSGIWNPKKIAKRTLKSDRVMYALAYSVLNNQPLHKKIEKDYLVEILKSAPWDGPCFGTEGCNAPDGWKSSDRWCNSDHKNGNPYGLHYEFAGLDYMLFYNLYHYLYPEEVAKYSRGRE